MPTLAHHLVFRRPDNGVLARNVPEQRALARAVLRIGRDAGLLAFHAAVSTRVRADDCCARAVGMSGCNPATVCACAPDPPSVRPARRRARPTPLRTTRSARRAA